MNRYLNIEWLKFVSAFSIVWFHSGYPYLQQVSYSGLVIFIMISLYFNVESCKFKGVKIMAKRLLIPWVFFSLFFGIGNLVLSKNFVNTDNGLIMGFLRGTYIHLWYLPFIFLALCISGLLATRLPRNILATIMFVCFTVYIVSTTYWREWSLSLGAPLAQYIHALGAVFLGVFLSAAKVLGREIKQILYVGLYIGIASSISVVGGAGSSISVVGVGVPYFIALSLVLLTFNLKSNLALPFCMNNAFAATFGVFLIHPVFLYIFKGHSGMMIYPLETFFVSLFIIISLRKTFPKLMLKVT